LDDDPGSWFEEVRFVDPMLLEDLRKFWKSLWQDKSDLVREVSVRRDPNPVESVDVPETMEVLRLPITFSSISEIMVRGDYVEAMKDIEGYSSGKTKSVIIVGHPGIGRTMISIRQARVLIYTPHQLGKTTLLYYILVKRLLEQKPTILQINTQHLFLFNANGVKAISSSTQLYPKSEEYQRAWALVDINQHVQTPAEMLGPNSPFFLIMASSPRASRWQWVQRYRAPVAFWLMKPFTLAELIQASVTFFGQHFRLVTYVISQSSTSRGRSQRVRY
jgi:hypothetical protein